MSIVNTTRPVANLMKAYQDLSVEERDLVNLLAVAYTPLSAEQIAMGLKLLQAKQSAKTLVKPLQQAGLLVADTRSSFNFGYSDYVGPGAVACTGSIIERITRQLAEDGRFEAIAKVVEAVAPLPRAYGMKYYFQSQNQVIRFARIAFYRGDFARIKEIFESLPQSGRSWLRYLDSAQQLDSASLFAGICGNPFDRDWFLQLPPEIVDITVPRLFGGPLVTWKGLDEGLQSVMADGCAGRLGHPVSAMWHYQLGLWRLIRGEFDACTEGVRVLQGSGLDACLILLREGPEPAISLFDAALADIGSRMGKHKPVLPGTVGALHLLALWLRNTGADVRKAGVLSALWLKRSPPGLLLSCLALVPGLMQHDEDARSRLAVVFGESGMRWDIEPLGFVLAYLLAAWFDKDLAFEHASSAQACADWAKQQGMAWPAAELTAILARLQPRQAKGPSDAADFEQSRNVTLLAHRIPLMEGWERALRALVALGAPEPDGDEAPKEKRAVRLAWLVSKSPKYGALLPFSLELREQKRTARAWSKGTRLSFEKLASLTAAGDDMLLEQDHLVARHIGMDRYRLQHSLTPRGWLALVGHPHILWADSSQPLEVVAGQLELRVKKLQGAAVQITLEPGFDDDQQVVLWTETPTRLKVAEITEAHRRIGKALGESGLTVPLSARDQVVEALGAVASLVTVHSDIGGASHASERVPADSQLRIQLLPAGAGLHVALLVRPFGEVGPYYPPGTGGKALFIEAEGKRLQTERDLQGERDRAEILIGACAMLLETESEQPFSWEVAEPESCLELLFELQALPDPVRVEWPNGEPFKLAGKADFRHLSLKVTQSRDWFALEGQLQVAEGQVLEMQRLFELLSRSRGRFVQLDDGSFLALTDAFRKRLGDLEALAELHGKSRRVHVLAAPLLEELAVDAGKFESDKAWRQRLGRLREAEALQPTVPDNLEAELRDYQVEGYQWLARLAHWGVGACLADDMGLGKTLQALALLLARSKDGPGLVVAPTSVGANWQSEARRFSPTLRVQVVGAQDRKAMVDALGPMDLLVCSYALLQQDSVAELLAGRSWRTIVLDEAQAIKNFATKRSQSAMNLQGDFKLITTGTPIENHLGELWNLFRFVNPGLLGSLESFNRRFSGPIERGDKEARSRLKRLVQPFVLRRLKSQVLDELPARTDIQLEVELSEPERAFYEALRRKVVAELQDSKAGQGEKHLQILAGIMKLRRSCCHCSLVTPELDLPSSKLAQFGELIVELLDNHHKALVFSQFVDHLSRIREYLDHKGISYQYLDGQTPPAQRKKRVDAFQAGEGDVFLISLKAGGLGLNLTAADYVIHMDPWWNPAIEDQASDRAHRIGQQRPVTVYRLVAKDTIEEKIVSLHRHKRDLADSVLAGTETAAKISADDLMRLIQEG